MLEPDPNRVVLHHVPVDGAGVAPAEVDGVQTIKVRRERVRRNLQFDRHGDPVDLDLLAPDPTERRPKVYDYI